MQISPDPTEEEAAAIIAATEALWPRPALVIDDDRKRPGTTWRFSGRWWAGPLAKTRQRP